MIEMSMIERRVVEGVRIRRGIVIVVRGSVISIEVGNGFMIGVGKEEKVKIGWILLIDFMIGIRIDGKVVGMLIIKGSKN